MAYQHAALLAAEPERLEALHRTGLLDGTASPIAKQLIKVVAEVFREPIVLLSLVDRDRQYFWCALGLDVRETHRDASFCAHALHVPQVLVVLDALQDPRFAANPLVVGAPWIRFYAGTPIHSMDGHRLGTLCLLGDKARSGFSPRKRKLLQQCAALASVLLASEAQALAVSRGQTDVAGSTTSSYESVGARGKKPWPAEQGIETL